MSDTARVNLKDLLVSRYTYLRRRLEFLVGSKDSAADALHETWLRLDTMTDEAPLANADAYLLRMATNVAIDQYRREHRQLHEGEIEELFDIPDELADPQRIVAARHEVEALKAILRGLPPRRRDILLAARIDGQLNREIAERFGISLRLVEKELSEALKYCNARMLDVDASALGNTKGRRKF
jgi:RNA polymerase sigma factor (sigma-70 family)